MTARARDQIAVNKPMRSQIRVSAFGQVSE